MNDSNQTITHNSYDPTDPLPPTLKSTSSTSEEFPTKVKKRKGGFMPSTNSGHKKIFGGGNGRAFATLLGIFLILGGVTAGVLLVKQNQDIREKAAETPSCAVNTTEEECNANCGYLDMGGTYWWECAWYDDGIEQHCNMTETPCGGTGTPSYTCSSTYPGSVIAEQCLNRTVGQTFDRTVQFPTTTTYCNQTLTGGVTYQCSYECVTSNLSTCEDNNYTCTNCGVTCYGCTEGTNPNWDWDIQGLVFQMDPSYVCPDPIGGSCDLNSIHAAGFPKLKPDHFINMEQCVDIYWCEGWAAECAVPAMFCSYAPTNYPSTYTSSVGTTYYLATGDYNDSQGVWVCGDVPYPPCLSTSTPAPTLTPIPTPTLPPTGMCVAINVYDTDWNVLTATDLPQLKPGDSVYFTVYGSSSAGTFTMARFTINGVLGPEVTDKKPGTEEFYYQYTIPAGVSNFAIDAEVYHEVLGWL